MAGAVVPMVLRGGVWVAESAGVRGTFAALARGVGSVIGRVANVIGLGSAAASVVSGGSSASGTSANPTPLAGGGGGGANLPPAVVRGSTPAGAPKPSNNSLIVAPSGKVVSGTAASGVKQGSTSSGLVLAKLKNVGAPAPGMSSLPIVVTESGKAVINGAVSAPLKVNTLQTVGSGSAAALSVGSIAQSMTSNPLKMLGIILAVSAAGVGIWALARR